MTDDDIAAMRADAEEQADILSGHYTIPAEKVRELLAEYGERCVEQVPLLLAEVERLRTALPIIEQLARGFTLSFDDVHNCWFCALCDANITHDLDADPIEDKFFDVGWREANIEHEPDCPVTKARDLLHR